METKLEQIAAKAVKQRPKSVVRENRTPRSVGTGGGRPPPVTRWALSNGRPYRDRLRADSSCSGGTQNVECAKIEASCDGCERHRNLPALRRYRSRSGSRPGMAGRWSGRSIARTFDRLDREQYPCALFSEAKRSLSRLQGQG